jgi:hypothetical protein
MTNDTRYPYTYACDFICSLAGHGEEGMKLSRSDASKISSGIAVALGMDDTEMVRKLADHYKANEGEITGKLGREFLAAHGVGA